MQNTPVTTTHPARTDAAKPARIDALDLARAGALAAMAVFHFVYDLELFGLLPPGTVGQAGWRWLAYLTAGSFLFLAGASLWLAHGGTIRWRGFWRRWAMIGGAALVITAGTAIAMPDRFIFFGILHAMAAASLLGLVCLRLPAGLLVGLAGVILILPQVARFSALDAPWFWWTGLQATGLRSVDYVPLFPWFAPFLLGLATAKTMAQRGLWGALGRWQAPPGLAIALWAGRHSLAIYLAHQPLLIAAIWIALQLRG
ncbi:MAG: hypothetical protein RLZZ491_1499 [Pseudomonadota bacterium]